MIFPQNHYLFLAAAARKKDKAQCCQMLIMVTVRSVFHFDYTAYELHSQDSSWHDVARVFSCLSSSVITHLNSCSVSCLCWLEDEEDTTLKTISLKIITYSIPPKDIFYSSLYWFSYLNFTFFVVYSYIFQKILACALKRHWSGVVESLLSCSLLFFSRGNV